MTTDRNELNALADEIEVFMVTGEGDGVTLGPSRAERWINKLRAIAARPAGVVTDDLIDRALDLLPRVNDDDPIAPALAEWCDDAKRILAAADTAKCVTDDCAERVLDAYVGICIDQHSEDATKEHRVAAMRVALASITPACPQGSFDRTASHSTGEYAEFPTACPKCAGCKEDAERWRWYKSLAEWKHPVQKLNGTWGFLGKDATYATLDDAADAARKES